MRATNLLRFCLPLALFAACGDDDKDLAVPDQCNPLGGSRCLAPYPSAVYEETDSTTETGVRLAFPANALPVSIDNTPIDPARYATHDGFSPSVPLMIAFDTGVDETNLVHFSNEADSLTDASPTVVIDMETGALVPHFAEIDSRAKDTPADQALFIRPLKMLATNHRYAVAIKKTLKAAGGGELPISEGFTAIVTGEKTTHPLLEKVRPRYPEIFTALAEHGIAKEDLVVAWDFTTRSRTQIQSDLLSARETTLAAIGTNAANLTFDVETSMAQGDTRIARRIDGTYKAPLFLTNGGNTASSTTLVRDADGNPMATGTYDVPFTAIVPACALDGRGPVGIMIYGHGLFGDGTQAASGGTRAAAAELCMVAIGTDMRGMSNRDVPNVVLALNDANNDHGIFEVLVQGMMNHIALSQIARGPMATGLFTTTGDSTGTSIVDPSKIYYYGISQGGIMGTTVCAIDPLLKHCVVQVGAINYSLLLERSRDWPQYRSTLVGAYPNNFDTALLISLLQQNWDRTEPSGWAETLAADTSKHVLMQIALVDDEVSNLASEFQARTMNIPVITPSPVTPYGITTAAGPVPSGMVVYDFGEAPIPATNEAPPDNDVHSNIRNKKATTDMMRRFYETGEIVNTCTAPTGCDCTVAGACGDAI